MAGILDKLGSSLGAVIQTVVIAPITVPTDESHLIREIETTMEQAGANMILSVQSSNDNFVGNIVERSRTEMPSGGTFVKSLTKPIKIPGGLKWRVVYSQSIAGTLSVRVSGDTLKEPNGLGADVIDS